MTPASIKDELHELIDAMDQTEAVRLLAMISLMDDDGEVTSEEAAQLLQAQEDMRLGRTIRGEDLERELGFRE